ncbi:hypothetical protein GGD61_003066 [Bradyrhizobium sp. SBR1B]|nr:hypothetical protein [Bradyrhizobium sp. SBR1B]
MTNKAAARLKSDGWSILETTGFLHLIGPLWERKVDGHYEFALATSSRLPPKTSTTTAAAWFRVA